MIFDIIFGIIGLGGIFNNSLNHWSFDVNSRSNAIQNKQRTYMTSKGVIRSVDNNHRVAIYVLHNGKYVDLDMETFQPIYYYPSRGDELEKEVIIYNKKQNKLAKDNNQPVYNGYYIGEQFGIKNKFKSYSCLRTDDPNYIPVRYRDGFIYDKKYNLILRPFINVEDYDYDRAREHNHRMIKLLLSIGDSEDEIVDFVKFAGVVLL